MATILIIFHVFTCVILVLVVLLQAGKDGGLGTMGGGGSQTVFGSSGGANFFTKFTTGTAIVFMATSIALTLTKSGNKRSVFDPAHQAPQSQQVPQSTPPTTTPAQAPEKIPTPEKK